MPQQTEQRTDENGLLAMGTVLGDASLAGYLLTQTRDGHVNYITDNLYSQSQVHGARSRFDLPMSINQNSQGTRFPKGIDAFVEAELKDSECLGFVPLTEGVYKVLTEKYKLERIQWGMRLAPENVSFDLYGRR